MNKTVTLIGYGEAGRTFARAADWRMLAQVFDLQPMAKLYVHDGVSGCDTLAAALQASPNILSLVTADQALNAATEAAKFLHPGALYFDMNSVAPETKRQACKLIEMAGGRYLDVAIMAPVNPAQIAVPLLVSGPHAQAGLAALTQLGFTTVSAVGDEIGRASVIKMLRSIMYKGVEALTAECLIACEKAGVTSEVLSSFNNDWSQQADYRLDRMLVHGKRRAAEMAEAVKTLEDIGVEPLLTRGTVTRHAQIGSLEMTPPPDGLEAKLNALGK